VTAARGQEGLTEFLYDQQHRIRRKLDSQEKRVDDARLMGRLRSRAEYTLEQRGSGGATGRRKKGCS